MWHFPCILHCTFAKAVCFCSVYSTRWQRSERSVFCLVSPIDCVKRGCASLAPATIIRCLIFGHLGTALEGAGEETEIVLLWGKCHGVNCHTYGIFWCTFQFLLLTGRPDKWSKKVSGLMWLSLCSCFRMPSRCAEIGISVTHPVWTLRFILWTLIWNACVINSGRICQYGEWKVPINSVND